MLQCGRTFTTLCRVARASHERTNMVRFRLHVMHLKPSNSGGWKVKWSVVARAREEGEWRVLRNEDRVRLGKVESVQTWAVVTAARQCRCT